MFQYFKLCFLITALCVRFWHQTSAQLWFRLFCVTSYEDFDQLWVSVQHFIFLKSPLDYSNTETKWNKTFKATNGKPTAYMQKTQGHGDILTIAWKKKELGDKWKRRGCQRMRRVLFGCASGFTTQKTILCCSI